MSLDMSSSLFHRKSLELLNLEQTLQDVPDELRKFQRRENLALPASYVEWCKVPDAQEILEFHSNTDKFYLYSPILRLVPGVGQALQFMNESQSNYCLVVPCASSGTGEDDPPVYFASYEEQERVKYCDTFSDAVYCQIFDWQLMRRKYGEDWDLDFEEWKVAYRDDLPQFFSSQFATHPTTQFSLFGQSYTEHRYTTFHNHRINLLLDATARSSSIKVTAQSSEKIELLSKELKSLLLEKFGAEIFI